MPLNSLGLGFLFTAQDLASGVMEGLGKNLKGLEEKTGKSFGGIDKAVAKMGTGLTVGAIGVGGLVATFGIADKAGEFEAALAAVGAVSNATAEDLAGLRKAAMDAGKATQYSPTQAILGLNELSQAGFDATESINLLQPSLALAAGSLGDLSPQEAAGLAAQALKAFGIDASLAGRAVDQMLQASNAFAVRAADLPLGLGNAARGAQTLNQSLTETIISFGLVKNVVPGTEKAATSVSSAMERLANPKVQKALKAQGVAVVDTQGNYRQFLDVVKDLMPALDKMSEKQRGAFLLDTFGQDALGSLNAIMGQFTSGIKGADGVMRTGAAAIDYLRNSFRGAEGVAEGFSKKMLDTFEGSKILMAGSMETLSISIGEPFKDAWRPIVDFVTLSLNWLIDVFEGMNPTVKSVGAAILVGAFAFLTFAGGILIIQALWPLLMWGLGAVSTALWGVVVATLAALWPWLLLGAGIAAIVYAVKNNIGGLGDKWDLIVERIKLGVDRAGEAFDRVIEFVTPLWEALQSGFNELWVVFEPIFSDIGDAIGVAIEAFADLASQFDFVGTGGRAKD